MLCKNTIKYTAQYYSDLSAASTLLQLGDGSCSVIFSNTKDGVMGLSESERSWIVHCSVQQQRSLPHLAGRLTYRDMDSARAARKTTPVESKPCAEKPLTRS